MIHPLSWFIAASRLQKMLCMESNCGNARLDEAGSGCREMQKDSTDTPGVCDGWAV